MELIKHIILIVISYFLGNISPSTMLAKAEGKDITKEGSGNAGTTNALRVLGKKAAIITLAIDVCKGFLAIFLASKILENDAVTRLMPSLGPAAALCGLAVFCGHVWPVLYGFKGGKGVATAFGVLLGYDWKIALTCLALVIIVVAITRMVSLGSILAALTFIVLSFIKYLTFYSSDQPVLSFWLTDLWPLILMAIILIIKHRANIERILKGKENKISL